MLKEFRNHVRIRFIMHRELDRYLQHVQAEQRHPGSAIRLFKITAGRQRRTAIEDTDIVQAEETPFKCVFARPILAVQPPCEIQQQFLKTSLKPYDVPLASLRSFQTIGENGGPRMDWWVDIAEIPLIGRNLAVWMQIVFYQHQIVLSLGKVWVDQT